MINQPTGGVETGKDATAPGPSLALNGGVFVRHGRLRRLRRLLRRLVLGGGRRSRRRGRGRAAAEHPQIQMRARRAGRRRCYRLLRAG